MVQLNRVAVIKTPQKAVESLNSRKYVETRSKPGPEPNPSPTGVSGPSGVLSEHGDTRLLVRLGQRTLFRPIVSVSSGERVMGSLKRFDPVTLTQVAPYEGYVFVIRCPENSGTTLTLRVTPNQLVLTDTGWTPAQGLIPKDQKVAILHRQRKVYETKQVEKLSIKMQSFILLKEFAMVRDRVWGLITKEENGYCANRFFLK